MKAMRSRRLRTGRGSPAVRRRMPPGTAFWSTCSARASTASNCAASSTCIAASPRCPGTDAPSFAIVGLGNEEGGDMLARAFAAGVDDIVPSTVEADVMRVRIARSSGASSCRTRTGASRRSCASGRSPSSGQSGGRLRRGPGPGQPRARGGQRSPEGHPGPARPGGQDGLPWRAGCGHRPRDQQSPRLHPGASGDGGQCSPRSPRSCRRRQGLSGRSRNPATGSAP